MGAGLWFAFTIARSYTASLSTIIIKACSMPSTFKSAFSVSANFRSLITRSSDNYAAIDGLRALSILIIILFHVFRMTTLGIGEPMTLQLYADTPLYLSWVWNADKSVDIFFVISGFLISGLLFREYQEKASINLKSFYTRRFLRLSPVYLFFLAIYGLVGAPNSENLWTNILYINNFLPIAEQAMGWSWTLAVEEQFYLLFPLFLMLVAFRSQYPLRWFVGLFITSFFLRFFVVYSDEEIWRLPMSSIYLNTASFEHVFSAVYDNLYTRYGAFLCGILMAYLHYHRRPEMEALFRKPLVGSALLLLSVVTILFIALIPIYDPSFDLDPTLNSLYFIVHRNVFGVALSVLILSCFYSQNIGARLVNRFLSLKVWYPIAQLSYSTYLVHYAIVGLVLAVFKGGLDHYEVDQSKIEVWWLLVCFVAASLLSLVLAVVTFVFIEKPFMKLRGGFRANLVTTGGGKG